MKNYIYIILFLVFCNFQVNNSLQNLVKKSITSNNWNSFNEFIDEEVKCQMCIDSEIYKSVINHPNRIDTIHNYLALFKKDIIITKELPELFANTEEFKINSIFISEKTYKANDFEIHVPKKDGTQIDLHFKKVNNKSKLTSIYMTP